MVNTIQPQKFFVLIFVLLGWAGRESPLSAQLSTDHPFVPIYKGIFTDFPDIAIGGFYTEPHRTIDQKPFYTGDAAIHRGSLIISGFSFENVPLQYDIWSDLLITVSSIHNQKIILNQAKIDRFVLADSLVFVRKDKNPGYFNHKNGFYREFVQGEIGLYGKYWLERKKRSSVFEAYESYINKERFFIEKDGVLHSVTRRKTAFELLNLTNRELKPLLREAKLKFRRDKPRYLELLVKFANDKE